MAKLLYPDFFNDVFGPIMQPGSSSAFAGVCRIGNAARALVRGEPRRVDFIFHAQSRDVAGLVNFMSDRGCLGGVMGLAPDDERLFDAPALAKRRGLAYTFNLSGGPSAHPGSVRIHIEDGEGNRKSLWASSVGGGMIKTHDVNGFAVEWQGDTHAVIVEDPGREISGEKLMGLRRALGESLVLAIDIKDGAGNTAYWFECSENRADIFSPALNNGKSIEIAELPALLPVVTRRDKKEQLFTTVSEWRRVAEDGHMSFVQAAIKYEEYASGWTEGEVWRYFERIAGILDNQIHSLENIGYDRARDTPLLPIYGRLWHLHSSSGRRVSDGLTEKILRYAFAVNAKLPGVRAVPGPMGTGGGYLFSALSAVRERHGFTRERLMESLVVAAGLGVLAYTHTNPSGRVGCAGESGICCAMASGAVAWLAGGDGTQVENAASMALQASLGIPCDPLAGGLEFPCLTRTLRAAVTAPLYADLALAGIDPLIPYHEVLQEIERRSRSGPSRELYGSRCGCNRTPTARACRERLEKTGLADRIAWTRKGEAMARDRGRCRQAEE